MEVSALKYHGHAGTGLHGRSPLLRLQSDERLIALLRRGNTSAFEVLVSRYESRLLAFCRHLLGSREDAEDVLQEVMTAAFNAIVADERPINVRPWLYRIARNRSLNHLRRTQAIAVDTMDFQLSEHGATTADKVHEREAFRLLVGDIHELPETQKTALVLREMDAMSYEQIAEAMETTVSSVKSLLVRARLSLAEAAEARALTCEEVRIELAEIAEGLLKRPSPLVKRHLKACDRCSSFRAQLKHTNKALAALLPVGPLVVAKKFAFIHFGHSAATAGGSGAAAGGATAAGGRRGRRRRCRCAGRRGRVLRRQRVHRRGHRRRRDQSGGGAGGRGAGDRRGGRGQQLRRHPPPSRPADVERGRAGHPAAGGVIVGRHPGRRRADRPLLGIAVDGRDRPPEPCPDRRDRQARRQDEADPGDDRDHVNRDRPDHDDPGHLGRDDDRPTDTTTGTTPDTTTEPGRTLTQTSPSVPPTTTVTTAPPPVILPPTLTSPPTTIETTTEPPTPASPPTVTTVDPTTTATATTPPTTTTVVTTTTTTAADRRAGHDLD